MIDYSEHQEKRLHEGLKDRKTPAVGSPGITAFKAEGTAGTKGPGRKSEELTES